MSLPFVDIASRIHAARIEYEKKRAPAFYMTTLCSELCGLSTSSTRTSVKDSSSTRGGPPGTDETLLDNATSFDSFSQISKDAFGKLLASITGDYNTWRDNVVNEGGQTSIREQMAEKVLNGSLQRVKPSVESCSTEWEDWGKQSASDKRYTDQQLAEAASRFKSEKWP